MIKFKCSLTGLCCKASPITLQSFEEMLVNFLAESMSIDVKIAPAYTIYDALSNQWIALSYTLYLNDDNKCPFLSKDNRCSIHSIYKPFICRTYPYVPREVQYLVNSELKLIIPQVVYGVSTRCPVIELHKPLISKYFEANASFIKEYMPSEYEAAIEAERARLVIVTLLSNLWRDGLVELVQKPPFTGSSSRFINAYSLLQRYNPRLPYILGIYSIVEKIRLAKMAND
ncbi:MAG: YkgJ family cysteine cluster protein [Sulfolobales archaeon]|nr:YkgJ family cysteine cluster protein [Sulfolobales archaeon]